MDSTHENKIELMMVQLLFKNKPKSPTADQLRKALEKHMGDLGEIQHSRISVDSPKCTFMFPLPKYKIVLKDAPEGFPVLATYFVSDTESGIEVDDMKRSQLWDVKNGIDIINGCNYTILVHTMLGLALPYREQAEILLAQVGAALDCYPECTGIYVPQSGKLITPEMFEADKKYSMSARFIKLFVNARFFNISNTDEMIVDTLGFHVFGGADIQVHFKNMNPNEVVSYVYTIASYQFDNDFPIKNGDTVDSIDKNGDIRISPQWKVQYENSLVEPYRTVLDINCGEYAGGSRK